MKKLAIILFILFITTQVYADKFQVPFECYPKEIQVKFAEHGLKLDLSGNDRTEDSFGFLENRGSEFYIYTYKTVEGEQLLLMLKI